MDTTVVCTHPAFDSWRTPNGDVAPVPAGNALGVLRSATHAQKIYGLELGRMRIVSVVGEQDHATFVGAIHQAGGTPVLHSSPGAVRTNLYDQCGEREACIAGSSTYEVHGPHVAWIRQQLEAIPTGSLVVLTGSKPPGTGITNQFYVDLVRDLSARGIKVILDVPAEPLQAVFASPYRPWAVKPNQAELAGLLDGKSPNTDLKRKKRAAQLLPDGYAIFSLGKRGLFVREPAGNAWRFRLEFPANHVTCTRVGCGDSTIGAFVTGLRVGEDPVKMFSRAVAASVANTASYLPGDYAAAYASDLASNVEVEAIK